MRQQEAAREYGQVVDLAFPNVAEDGDETYIAALSEECVGQIVRAAGASPVLCI